MLKFKSANSVGFLSVLDIRSALLVVHLIQVAVEWQKTSLSYNKTVALYLCSWLTNSKGEAQQKSVLLLDSVQPITVTLFLHEGL